MQQANIINIVTSKYEPQQSTALERSVKITEGLKQGLLCFTVFGAVHFLMRIMFVTSVTNQRKQFEYYQCSNC